MSPRISLTAAALQMTTGADTGANLGNAQRLLAEAAASGARLAVLPENFAFMGAREADKLALREMPGRGPIQEFLAAAAARHQLWIVAGTLPMAVPEQAGKVYAASLVYNPQGECVARYDKVHLFDVDVPRDGKSESYRESNSIEYGAVTVRTLKIDAAMLGLSVCYDLRFPELYRALAAQGAEILSVPSAFTEATGEAHWEVLLRARAIENQCYVIAPNQSGTHPGGRRTWGHSMIVDPWGRVVAQRAAGEGVVTAELDLAHLAEIRRNMPCLKHRRLP